MKKVIFILLCIFTFSSISLADEYESIKIIDEGYINRNAEIQVICIHGYAYAVVRTPLGTSITQMMEPTGDGRPSPIKCK